MRILFVYSGNSISGNNIIVQNQARSLADGDLEISHFRICNKGLGGYLKNVLYLSRYLINNQIDIIHAHYGLSGLVSYFAKHRTYLIVSFMGSDLIGSVSSRMIERLKNSIYISLNIFFARYFYDHTIVKSSEMGERLLGKTKYSIIPNGVFLRDFYPMDQVLSRLKMKLDINKKIVLFISDPSRIEKNYSLFVESVKLLNAENIIAKTIFNQPHASLLSYYNSADVILVTSLYEGSPNVIKEAMACNCPVVSTRVGDVEWLFGDTPGYFVTSFEPADVAKKIKLAIEFKENLENTNGRKRIIELGLDSEQIAQKILSLYKLKQ